MIQVLNISWKNLSLLIGYPILISLLLEVLIQGKGFSTFLNFQENLIFGVIIFFLINLLSIIKYGSKLGNVILVFFYSTLFIETGLFLLFQTRFNASYIYVMLNSNAQEVTEFSSVYYSSYLLWLLLFLVPLFSLFPKKIFLKSKSDWRNIVLSFLIIFSSLFYLKYSKLIIYNLPYIFVKSYMQYQNQVDDIEKFNKQENNVSVKTTTENDLVVVVIGESVARKHMGVYGYERKTTPELQKISDSLQIYTDVISPHVFTTGSLYEILTLSNYENPKASNSLINYLKNAGNKVYWLSNQRPVGFHDNLISRLASSADESLFLSFNDFKEKTSYDEVLLPILKEKISTNEKKVVFLHLIGNHYAYDKRYPVSFNRYKMIGKTNKQKLINSYDNAILYNDFVVSEILKTVKEQNKKSAVVYLSDHGEEVYDTTGFFGHFEDRATRPMYEVPFVLWMSSTFEKPTDFSVDTSRKYMLDDFPHSLAHLMGLKSDKIQEDRSVFSIDFKQRKRFVQDSLDFDFFKVKNYNEK